MQKYNVKIGLVPLRRDCTARPGTFNWEFAEARGRELVKYIKEHYTTENVSFVDLKGVIDVEVLWSTNDVDKVVKHFNDNGVDSIVLICANFGNEEAAGQTVFHFHMHVIPRYKEDGQAIGWKPGQVTSEELEAVCELLK